jgi:mannose-6-phosphate isomerase-like protein (cupin superfamily)
MIVRRGAVKPFDFKGLSIRDLTAGQKASSSVAVIDVPPAGKHQEAYSKRSDKYYYIVSGKVRFIVAGERTELGEGDLCLIEKGERFSYENPYEEEATLVLFHTPPFDLASEVLLEEDAGS